MPSLRKRGLELGPGVVLRSSESATGEWVAWIEKDGDPIVMAEGTPRLFEGPTSYQAQCHAMKWLRANERLGEDAPRSRGVRRRSASG